MSASIQPMATPHMLSDVRYDKANNIVRVTFSGDVTPEDLRDALQQITTADEYPADVSVIWHMLNVNFFNLDIEQFSKLKDVRDKYSELRDGARAAIIVPGDIEGSLMKMFYDLANAPSGHFKIVNSPEEAEEWCLLTG